MTNICDFIKFVRGAIRTIQLNSLSGILIGYRYWRNTSPFLARIKTTFQDTEYHLEPVKQNTMPIENIPYEKQKIDVELRKELQFRFSRYLYHDNQPLVSIVIPTFDQVDLLRKCLKSIEEKTTYKNYEIIIVTNNLEENSQMRMFLSTLKYAIKIYAGEYSFSTINNFGVSFCKGDFYLFLNDDTEIISEQWIEFLLHLGIKSDVGVVGGKLLYPNGKLQEAGSIIWRNGNAWNFGKDCSEDNYQFNYVREVDYSSASLLLVKKEVFAAVGGFDTCYAPAYWEDADLCLKIKNKGFKVMYQPLCKVVHAGGKSNDPKNIQRILLTNKKKFVEKWSTYISTYPPESSGNLSYAINKKNEHDILYVDHKIPEYDKDAGSLRTFYILLILNSMGYKITFWPMDLQKREPYTTELQQRGIEVVYGNHKLSKFLSENKKFKIVILSRPDVAIRAIDLVIKKLPQSKIIYDSVDLQFLSFAREAKYAKNKSKLIESNKMYDLETKLMKKSHVTIFTSINDAQIIYDKIKNIKSVIIPNIHITVSNPTGFDERKDLLFVGSFNHKPNIDTIRFFVSTIFPLITMKIPEIKLFIVGSNPTKEIQDMQSDNILVLGHIEDISKYYNSCKVLVAPIQYGAGIKGKISESLSYGLPIITTPLGVEGMNLVDSENCMISDDPNKFADKLIRIYTEKDLWEKLSNNGLLYAKDNFSPEVVRVSLKKPIQMVI